MMTRKITKAEALEFFGVDLDNVVRLEKDDTGQTQRGRSSEADRIADKKRRAHDALMAALSEALSAKNPDHSLAENQNDLFMVPN
jgi:hypothetical protein